MNNKSINNVSEKYISDVVYQSDYDSSINPLFIYYISVLNGFEQYHFNDSFRYCDLGCGDGSTINILACLFPDAKFYGIDFNEAHINSATNLAHHYGLENITYYRLDFSDLESLDLPDLDFISCIGAFSWVNIELQKEIIRFAGSKLADNGKFVVQYAAKPGKIQVDPLWHFMREVCSDDAVDSVERAMVGVKYIENLMNKGALFFKKNPVALNIASKLHERDIKNIAHNALSDFQVLNHSDVARDLFEYGLSFAGDAFLIDNHIALTVPDRFIDDINSLDKSSSKETMKDLILNRGLRTDIFIKNKPDLSAAVLMDEIYFGISLLIDGSPGTVHFKSGISINYDDPIYASLIDVLANKALKLPDIILKNNLQDFTRDKIRGALNMLIAIGVVMPYKEPGKIYNIDNVADLKPTTFFTDTILKSEINLNQSVFLPSSFAGQSFSIDPVILLFLKAHVIYKVDDAVDWVSNLFKDREFPLKIQNIDIGSIGQLRGMLEQSYKKYTDLFLPWLIRVGILE